MKNKNYILVFVGIVLVVFFGYRFFEQKYQMTRNQTITNQESNVKLVDSLEFSNLIKGDNRFLLDVHIPEQTHIPGTDAFIAYNEISSNISELPEDKNTPILIYCRSGSMSRIASEELVKLGYTNVYDLEGGTNAYKEHNNQVVISPDTIDLGTVVYGDVAKTNFTFTNYTPLPMKITRVSTSCGCTSASVEKEELAAYEATKINVSFDPAVHNDDTDLGDIERTIYINTDNPNYPKLTSTITAKVIKENL